MEHDTQEQLKIDYRWRLTTLLSYFSLLDMARFRDIVSGISQQTVRKSEELARDLEELNALRASWQRYQELSKQVASKEQVIKIGYGLLLSAPQRVNTEADAYASPDAEFYRDAERFSMDAVEIDLSRFSLWRVVREIIRQTSEIRIYELEAHLKQFGLKASRSAIESALATHPKEFRISKRGREKFVSLK